MSIETKSDRLTNEDFHSLFQDNILGQQIFSHLYLKFLTGKQFHADPYINAYNCGMAEVINYIVSRCRETPEESTTNQNNRIDRSLE